MMFDDSVTAIAHSVSRVIELAGVGIIAGGALITLVIFLVQFARREKVEQAIGDFRSRLGRAILLGLEFLVAADIINTVAVDPSLDSLAVLAGIVAIRTFLSFSLEVEIEGRWPWERGTSKRREI